MTSGLTVPWATLPLNGFWFEGAVIFMLAAGVESEFVPEDPLPPCAWRFSRAASANKQRMTAVETATSIY